MENRLNILYHNLSLRHKGFVDKAYKQGWTEHSKEINIWNERAIGMNHALKAIYNILQYDSSPVDALVMPKIDEYISKLQVFGYTIRINNHNIGDIHNITIRRYEPLDKKREMFVLQQIDFLQLRLPSEADKLFEVFEKLLKDAEKP